MNLPADLNPNIIKTVTWLQAKGFVTTDSGDGRTYEFPCDRPYAYVVMVVTPPELLIEESRRLQTLLHVEHGISLVPVGEDAPSMQGSYDPMNDLSVLDLMYVDDSMIRDVAPPTPQTPSL